MPVRQLALPFPQTAHFADYLECDANRAALAWLAEPRAWPSLRLAVHGEPGVGKTHLLHRFASQTGGAILDGATLRTLPGRPATPIAIDDADDAPEPAILLHWLNAAAEHGQPALLAGRSAPSRWGVALPDLDSRLRATPAVELHPPDDALLATLLARLLAERQLAVPPAVQDFLRARLPRTGGALREAAARLDHASLANGRAVTRGLAASVIAAMAGEAEHRPQDPDAQNPGALSSAML